MQLAKGDPCIEREQPIHHRPDVQVVVAVSSAGFEPVFIPRSLTPFLNFSPAFRQREKAKVDRGLTAEAKLARPQFGQYPVNCWHLSPLRVVLLQCVKLAFASVHANPFSIL